MTPARSERNFTATSTADASFSDTTAGVWVGLQIVHGHDAPGDVVVVVVLVVVVVVEDEVVVGAVVERERQAKGVVEVTGGLSMELSERSEERSGGAEWWREQE